MTADTEVAVTATLEDWRRTHYVCDPRNCGTNTFEGLWRVVGKALARHDAQDRLTIRMPPAMASLASAGLTTCKEESND